MPERTPGRMGSVIATWILAAACTAPPSEIPETEVSETEAAEVENPETAATIIDASAVLPPAITRLAMDWVPSPHFRRGHRIPLTVDSIAIHTT